MRIYLMMLEVPTAYLRYLFNKSEEFINKIKEGCVCNVRNISGNMDDASSKSSRTAVDIFSKRKFKPKVRL